jgi:hypothetical protein
MKIYPFNDLDNCDLVIDAIYEGGNNGNVSDDPISKILSVGNQGGFRYAGSLDKLKYIILYTTGEHVDWPDTIDIETGILQYYGDNQNGGYELHDTPKKGNLILKKLFESLHSQKSPREYIPPIFIFKKHPTFGSSRSIQFKGLCVPGTTNNDPLKDLVAIWKSSKGFRFQNYSAFFTILDISTITRKWIKELNLEEASPNNTPKNLNEWKENGTYNALITQRTLSIRTISEQLPTDQKKMELLGCLFEYFSSEPTLFEYLAAEVFRMTDSKIIIDEVTRGAIDGGRDALGRIKLGLDDDPIYAEFAIEAKCYYPGINSKGKNTEQNNISEGVNIAGGTRKKTTVGVKEVSRLISRIRNRQFGILITTSVVSKQAYEEVRADGHPIIFLSGKDVIDILFKQGHTSKQELLKYLTDNYTRS